MKRQRSAAIKHAFAMIRVFTSAFLRNTGDQKNMKLLGFVLYKD